MSTHCRCRICDRRKAIKRHPDNYIRPPKCVCGGSLRVDKWANSRPWRRSMCHCDGVWFSIKGAPHRKGSGQCNYNENRSYDQ